MFAHVHMLSKHSQIASQMNKKTVQNKTNGEPALSGRVTTADAIIIPGVAGYALQFGLP